MAFDTPTLVTIGFFLTMMYTAVYTSDIVEVRRAFMCDECAFRKCPALTRDCEMVREPGICSCCLTCAREEGDFCGINLGRCGRGFKCRPKQDDPNPLLALLQDTAICQRIKRTYSYEDIFKSGKQF